MDLIACRLQRTCTADANACMGRHSTYGVLRNSTRQGCSSQSERVVHDSTACDAARNMLGCWPPACRTNQTRGKSAAGNSQQIVLRCVFARLAENYNQEILHLPGAWSIRSGIQHLATSDRQRYTKEILHNLESPTHETCWGWRGGSLLILFNRRVHLVYLTELPAPYQPDALFCFGTYMSQQRPQEADSQTFSGTEIPSKPRALTMSAT